jgi:NADP-dependent alcohol dehydrogenase
VLTLPATGSEMNTFAVVSRKSTQEKLAFGSPLVYPVFSILDPETTYSLPPRQIANGIADAFTHVMEQYMTYPVNAALQDRMAESILITLIEEGPKTMADPTDYDARANVVWCSTMALNGLIGVGVPQDWATHSIGHELTAFHGIDHARTLAVVMPYLWRIKRGQKEEKLIQYAERVWNITSGTREESAEAAIRKTIEFYESLGIPTKASAYGVGNDTIEKIVKRFEERGEKAMGEHQDITPAVVGEILSLSVR